MIEHIFQLRVKNVPAADALDLKEKKK